ncbi:MAG: hypothetical protein R6W83_05735 [Cryobacterium sp.]
MDAADTHPDSSAQPESSAQPDSSAPAESSAQRLIDVIQSLSDFDVALSSDEDRVAVSEMVALTNEEHQRVLLIALLLERVRAR